jgi:hypothetical protein
VFYKSANNITNNQNVSKHHGQYIILILWFSKGRAVFLRRLFAPSFCAVFLRRLFAPSFCAVFLRRLFLIHFITSPNLKSLKPIY